MSKFKLGEKVVAIVDHSKGRFKKGDEFVIDGFTCCPSCGMQCVYLKSFNPNPEAGTGCTYCNPKIAFTKGRNCFKESSFEKLISLSETTEYRLRVTIPELTKIKEHQLT